MRRRYSGHEGERIIRLFALMGGTLWIASAMFVILGFGRISGDNNWIDMHHDKLLVGVGIGFAGIGTLFICFAALISVLVRVSDPR